MRSTAAAQPPDALAIRVGGSAEGYRDIAEFHRERILSLLPADWSWTGKRVLDFGCGPGRTLSELVSCTEGAEFVGCDIHEPSIAWARAHLPGCTFVLNEEQPPLDLESGSFDLVYAVSVFTHLTDHWSDWLAEVHRLLRPGGLAIVSFLGEALWEPFGAGADADWVDEETGMMVTLAARPWDEGGPNVFHSEWWLREHWGRGFDIVELRARDTWRGADGHGWTTLRRREGELAAADLERFDPSDPREARALARNLRILTREARGQADTTEHLRGEIVRLRAELDGVYSGKSWRVTAPLRAAATIARKRAQARSARPSS
jgi:SAM-dependent methyltransferase